MSRGSLKTWLYKITLNATRDYYRKESKEKAKEEKLLHPDHTLYLHDKVIGFAVIHTENGWRAAFMQTQ
ncbi:hypothetical protein FG383_15490 [Psychrobacillus soli]|uniref:Uncharacterized protein n=1 Tax=Psychrobacillus soli TaxID=1543965 RepID=A0A544SXK3_9BACI|nr:hypothetical protein [Psychrobacillus soli]TQR09857.1 hypothetical protein FG383_15490 [Psychrobacillus soli]